MIDHDFLGAHRFAPAGTTCRVLFLGEDNPQSADERHALFPYPPGCAGERLSNILGLSTSEHLAIWRTNLCNPTWSVRAARERRDILLSPDVPWSVVILLGRKVAGVFFELGVDLPAFSRGWLPATGAPEDAGRTFSLVSLPHPSGRNLVWNNKDAWRQARALAREVAPEQPFGRPEDVS